MRDENRVVALAVAVVLNIGAFALFWLFGLGLMQFAQRAFVDWPATALAQVVACAIGVAISIRLRAAVSAYVVAGQLAYSVAELLIHSIYGIRAAQGAPTQFAIMGAGTIGVIVGALLVRHINWQGGSTSPLAASTIESSTVREASRATELVAEAVAVRLRPGGRENA